MDGVCLVHASDLHFGDTIGYSRFREFPFDGSNGHQFVLCDAFSGFVSRTGLGRRPASDASIRLVLSGDLTRTGRPAEFDVAHTFLQSQWVRHCAGLLVTGLRLHPHALVSVPGNHDHWAQGPYNAGLFDKDFHGTPWPDPVVLTSAAGDLRVELYGVDSNSGLRGRRKNLRQEGVLASEELDGLERALEKMNAKEWAPGSHRVRVIVCHHGLFGRGALPAEERKNYPTLERLLRRVWVARHLDAGSRRRLVKIAGRYDVAVVLTGHLHEFMLRGMPYAHGQGERRLWEVRCPATLQGRARDGRQGFLEHRIAVKDGVVHWWVKRHWWYDGRFVAGGEREVPGLVYS
jgi:Calcineurin-like phosphoesterase